VWQAALCDGYTAAQLQEARRKISEVITDVEAQLTQHPWLADSTYSLADGAAFAFIMLLPQLTPELVNARNTPQIMRWLTAMQARPAVAAALQPQRLTDPCALIAPGPEPIRWG
jgi:glutathione S-transferase